MGPLKKVDPKFLYGWNISTTNPIYCEVWYAISMFQDTCHSLTVASASLSHPVIDKILCFVFSLITTVLLESHVALMLNTSLIIMFLV